MSPNSGIPPRFKPKTGGSSATAPVPPRRPIRAKRTEAKPLDRREFPPPVPVPSRARRPGQGDPLFFAGAGLALLDAVLRGEPPAAGALRSRLALQSAAASAKILRLNRRRGPAARPALRHRRRRQSPRQGCCGCGATAPIAHLRSTPTVSPKWRRGSTWFCRT